MQPQVEVRRSSRRKRTVSAYRADGKVIVLIPARFSKAEEEQWVRDMPAWVVDYVLLHELAHLLEAGHNRRFWQWVDRYPRAERAKGYLEGVAAAAELDVGPCD
jgi:predicted metal-dependent hydrolase